MEVRDRVAVIRLDRPDRKNPLTFESYAELRDTSRALPYADDVDVVVLASNGGNFCSGGDVHDIIGPLVDMDMKGLLAFTRMTGDLGEGDAQLQQAGDRGGRRRGGGRRRDLGHGVGSQAGGAGGEMRLLFTRVGLAGCDMGLVRCCPRSSGRGRAGGASLYRFRAMSAEEGAAWGFWNAIHLAERLEAEAMALAARIAAGADLAHGSPRRS